MLTEKTMEKLRILTESAKYDVSCSSSGTVRSGKKGMVGNTVGGMGICHSFADDGRCISLLKIMLTNYCMYDCAYCINRRSNDIQRATLSVSELEEITMEFYRRNYIEGLFLSSGVVRNPDYTMERLTAIVRDLRTIHRFNGYIHLKAIPGASQELLAEAGRYADRMSVNIEIPKEESLKALAPEKDHQSVFQPMRLIQQSVLENKEERRKFRHAPRFVPAGQSTQMIVGATNETDKDILQMSSSLYQQPTMRRVYYSGYISV
ncbi:MAG: putative DNA modification/repair radical SAM protein, partial [Paludibacteraceae bacterium]|nr:putative DNA modification/repair radical SAM protein [Paludibacteraceae bacterium]